MLGGTCCVLGGDGPMSMCVWGSKCTPRTMAHRSCDNNHACETRNNPPSVNHVYYNPSIKQISPEQQGCSGLNKL
jgi:hypothetical protein